MKSILQYFHPLVWIILCRSFFEPGTQALMIDFTEDGKKEGCFFVRYTAINITAVIGLLLGVWLLIAAIDWMYVVIALWMLSGIAIYRRRYGWCEEESGDKIV